MSFPLRVHLDLRRARELLHQVRRRLPDARRDIVEQFARETLARTIPFNPVDTGRSRAAWVAGLEQLAGTPPSDWRGPHPDAAAIHEGTAAGRLERHDNQTTTDLRVTNSVTYVPYLEYGTRRTPPRAMARRALREALRLLPTVLHTLQCQL